MNKTYKIICCLILIITIGSMVCEVRAGFYDVAKQFITDGIAGKSETGLQSTINMENVAKTRFQEIIDFLWGLGLLVIFMSAVILGIKYMFATPDNKANVKQSATPFIVGVVIIFGALTIWKLVIEILNGSL